MRGRAHCSTHHTRGRALFERQVSPPHCQRKPKASKPEGQRAKTSEASQTSEEHRALVLPAGASGTVPTWFWLGKI